MKVVNAMLELKKYQCVLRDFIEAPVSHQGKPALTLIHEHSIYDDQNIDFWYHFGQDMKPFLQLEKQLFGSRVFNLSGGYLQ